jgi:nitrite reductase/ring-hydroxylating ferredoxin subunit
MGLVITLEAVSLALRWWAGPSSHPLAVGLSTAGFALLLGGAYLGGHLVFAIGTMVNRNAFAEPPQDFVPVGAPGDFPDDALVRVSAAGMPVLVVRRGGVLHAIAATCSHLGGPLDEGELNADVITCPWHGSRFCITSGNVVSGPASFAVPLFTVREVDGRVEVKAAIAAH